MTVLAARLTNKKDTSLASSAYLSSMSLRRYDDISSNARSFLHPSELAYFSSLEHRRRQESYLVGRYVCKQVLSHYLGEGCLTDIEIAQGVFGQPIVRYPSAETPAITLSHSDKFAVAMAFSEVAPIAVDIEIVEQSRVQAIQSVLTEKELALTRSGMGTEDTVCTLLWTAKEALSKAIRCGLTVPFTVFEIDTGCLTLSTDYPETIELAFVNFPLMKAHSCIAGDQVTTIVLPRHLEMDLGGQPLHSLFDDSPADVAGQETAIEQYV